MTMEIPAPHRIHLAYINGQLNRTAPDDEAYTSPKHIQRIFKRKALSKKKNLTIYVHGGIVSSSDNLFEHPFHQNPESFQLFNLLDTKTYPIFFIWETGVVETLRAMQNEGKFREILLGMAAEEVNELLKGFLQSPIRYLLKMAEKYIDLPVFKALERHVPVALESSEGLGATSEDDEELFQELLDNDIELRAHLEEVAQAMIEQEEGGLGAVETELPLDADFYSKEFLEDIRTDYQENAAGLGAGVSDLLLKELFQRTVKALLAIYKEVKRRRKINRDHGLWPTIVEEALDITKFSRLFAAAWDQMKENARETYAEDNPATDNIGPRGGRYFLNCLADFLLKQPKGPDGMVDFDVSLVGHSAGAIHLSHCLATAEEIFKEKGLDNFVFKNLILLAPAVNIDIFSELVLPNSHLIKSLRIFTMQDNLEIKDQCAGLFYPRSLLYLVSGAAEHDPDGDKPLLGLQRHLNRESYKLINGMDKKTLGLQDFLDKPAWPQYVIYSIASQMRDGENCSSEHHGAFDNDPATQKSILALL